MTFVVAPRTIVVDASVSIELLLGRPDWVARWRSWIEPGDILVAPAHFDQEIANALLLGVRLPAHAATAAVERLFGTGVEIVDRGLGGLAGSIHLAAAHRLTVYDAAYLDLALDLDGELATLDRALQKAATAEGIAIVA